MGGISDLDRDELAQPRFDSSSPVFVKNVSLDRFINGAKSTLEVVIRRSFFHLIDRRFDPRFDPLVDHIFALADSESLFSILE